MDYKNSIETDPEVKEKYQQELDKPIPKMKVWQIQKQEEQIQEGLMPPMLQQSIEEKRKGLVAQVWEENANKPTMTL